MTPVMTRATTYLPKSLASKMPMTMNTKLRMKTAKMMAVMTKKINTKRGLKIQQSGYFGTSCVL